MQPLLKNRFVDIAATALATLILVTLFAPPSLARQRGGQRVPQWKGEFRHGFDRGVRGVMDRSRQWRCCILGWCLWRECDFYKPAVLEQCLRSQRGLG